MPEELKPCPFCGRSGDPWGPELQEGSGHFNVHCLSCYASAGSYDGPDGRQLAIDAWNRRGYFGERQKITEEWLKSIGFKWAQFDRQNEKQWILWIGGAITEPDGTRALFTGAEDLGIEISADYRFEKGVPIEPPEKWFCWFRGDCAGRYHRFIHLRHILWQDEVIALVEALTGKPWNPTHVLYGQLWTPEVAERLREDEKRLDRRLHQHPWTEAYKDPDRAKPLPEHVDAAVKGGLAK